MWQYLKLVALGPVVVVGLLSIVASPNTTTNTAPGRASITLTHQQGDAWYVYRGTSTDPAAGRHAVIRSVTISPGSSFSLAHGDDPTFYAMSPGESNVFNGKPAEGAWSAQFSGNRNDAPAAIMITVDW
jgi:hypothetical protein